MLGEVLLCMAANTVFHVFPVDGFWGVVVLQWDKQDGDTGRVWGHLRVGPQEGHCWAKFCHPRSRVHLPCGGGLSWPPTPCRGHGPAGYTLSRAVLPHWGLGPSEVSPAVALGPSVLPSDWFGCGHNTLWVSVLPY